MSRYQTVLLDADMTLMDFHRSEREALREVFTRRGYAFGPEEEALYQKINNALWDAFARGEIDQDFLGVEHRMEKVLKVWEVLYVNDSKATNVNSTWYALESIKTPIVWIAGGKDKGNDYEPLYGLVKDKVHTLICLGIDNGKLHDCFKDKVENLVDTTSAKEAVELAYKYAKPGDTVLLSPACASFDLFKNYEDRGRQFKAAVREL